VPRNHGVSYEYTTPHARIQIRAICCACRPVLPYDARMATRLPLSALLSRTLVAFTIEFDNEFERQMPHRTTRHGSSEGGRSNPWLASMVMWLKFMRFIPADGISARELQLLTGLTPKSLTAWLTRLGKWWGYLTVDRAGVVRPTAGGRLAQTIWLPLTGADDGKTASAKMRSTPYGTPFPRSPGNWIPACPIICQSSATACSAKL
jgi:hypothetical protein